MPQYRVKDPMCALAQQAGKQVVTQLPAGVLLEPRSSPHVLRGMVEVVCEEKPYKIFEWDLIHKAERVMGSAGNTE